MDLRVASNLAPSAARWANLRVAPNLQSSSIADDESSGCPESCILRLFRRWIFEFPRISHLRRRCGRISGLPRIFNPPASPTMSLRVAPNPASSGCADGESPGRPESSLLRQHQVMDLRVTSNLAPSGCAAPASSGCPESCICGWVDDESPAGRELCILGLAADESSRPIGFCTFLPNSGCILNFNRAFHAPDQPAMDYRVQPNAAPSCQAGTAFPIPYRVTNWKGA